MTQREGIEIDYCPECRGVWLDRGELDKIIERSASWSGPAADEPRRDDSRPDQPPGGKPEKKKKRGSFVGELFESFGDVGG